MLQENVDLTARDCLSMIIYGKHVKSETTLLTLKQVIIVVFSRNLIKLKKNSCSCWYFSEWGICKHAVAFSYVYDLSWFGDKYRIERSKFHTLLKKGNSNK